jgi:competence protein ComEC
LATAPICALNFNEFSVIGILTNFLILPWTSAILILGFLSSAAGLFFMPLSLLINNANLVLLLILNWIVLQLSALPFATFVLATPSPLFILIYYLGLVIFVEQIKNKRSKMLGNQRLNASVSQSDLRDKLETATGRSRFPINCDNCVFWILVLVFIVSAFWVWSSVFTGVWPDPLKITVLDVGQGDSILVEASTGEKMLIDGGDRGKGDKIIIPFLKKRGITKLDLVVLTHPHADHLLGLLEVMQKVRVGQVFDSGQNCDFAAYHNFLALVHKNNIKYHLARGGQIYTLAKDVKLQIFNPLNPLLSGTNSDLNSNSVAFRLKYRDFTMFFTGDMEVEGEERVLSSFPQGMLRSQILKVGHHGSRTATSLPFLEAVSSRHAIISCGRHNRFKHPHKSTLRRLKEKGIKLYRTDQDGAVVIETDGFKVRCRAYANML